MALIIGTVTATVRVAQPYFQIDEKKGEKTFFRIMGPRYFGTSHTYAHVWCGFFFFLNIYILSDCDRIIGYFFNNVI